MTVAPYLTWLPEADVPRPEAVHTYFMLLCALLGGLLYDSRTGNERSVSVPGTPRKPRDG